MSTAEATERGKQLFRELDLDGPLGAAAEDAVRRPAPPARHRRRPDPRAGAGVPRRADHRPRPAGAGQPVGAHPGPARGAGTTVFLTTHYLDEADALCDRILVIDHGAIVAAGTPDELKSQVGGDVLTVTVGRRRAGRPTCRRLVGALPGAEAPQRRRRPGRRPGAARRCARWSSWSAGWTGRASRQRHREPSAEPGRRVPRADRAVAAGRRDARRPAPRREEVTGLMRTLLRDTGTVFRGPCGCRCATRPGWSSA